MTSAPNPPHVYADMTHFLNLHCLSTGQGILEDYKLTPHSLISFTSSPSPIILHDGFLSPAPAFPIDALSTHLAPTSRAPSPLALPFHSVFHLDINNNITTLDETAKSPKTETTAPPAAAAEAHRAQRPPPRPHAAFKSTFDLEPNPFEQSFSRSSHHSNSSSSEDRNTPPRGTDATAIKHNALPPLSSLTSPAAADPSQFPWLASQSLRTGPLSPAMLAGPQGHAQNGTRNGQNGDTNVQEGGAFDSTTFRTGFTPGTGSGFTPSYSSLMGNNFASSLPMPSPNTAAFLNMVTNSTPLGESGDATQNGTGQPHLQPGQTGPDGQPLHPPTAIPPHMQPHHGLSHLGAHAQGDGQQQDTITPGTLSALTGVFNDMNRGAQIQHPPMNGQVVPPQFFQPNMHHPQGPPPPAMPPHGVPGVDFAQQTANAASQAANGLFLLSQAHQELSKREEEGRGPPLSGKKGGVNAANIPRPPTNTTGSKRKSDAGPAKGTKKGKKNNGGANASLNSPPNSGIQPGLASSKGDSASPNFEMDMDSEDEEARIARGGKPETEEEKRKNFLERNRQGKRVSSAGKGSV